jgi:hypothetical protein
MHHHSRFLPVSNYKVLQRMFNLYRQVNKQERYLNRNLPALLNDVSPGLPFTFSAKDVKRITKYWQLGLNLICGNLYHLTGNKLHEDEEKRIILLSVFGPLFDDLFDDKILDHEQIASLIARPSAHVAIGSTDRLVTKIYLELLRLTPRPDLFVEQLQAVSFWQKESLKQLNDTISEEELYRITYNKSYFAVLLFCAALDHYPNAEMLEMLYPVAGLMQLTNDAFDVYKDIHNGIYTLPNLYRNFGKLQEHFLAETAMINHTLWQMPYDAKCKQEYAITIHSLHAMGWMALEQLKRVTTGVTTVAGLRALSRKTLVCDMDSLRQKKKWLTAIRRLTNYQDLSSGNRHADLKTSIPV